MPTTCHAARAAHEPLRRASRRSTRTCRQISAPVLLLTSREDHVVTSDNGDRPRGPRWWDPSSGCGSRTRITSPRSTTIARLSSPMTAGFLARVFCLMALAAQSRRRRQRRGARAAGLSDGELDLFTEQLGRVLEHAQDIAALDLEDVVRDRSPLRTRSTSCARTWSVRASTATTCSPWRPTPRTDASPCRGSWARRRENARIEIAAEVRSGGDAAPTSEVDALAGSDRARNEALNVFLHVDEDGRARGGASRRRAASRRARTPGRSPACRSP